MPNHDHALRRRERSLQEKLLDGTCRTVLYGRPVLDGPELEYGRADAVLTGLEASVADFGNTVVAVYDDTPRADWHRGLGNSWVEVMRMVHGREVDVVIVTSLRRSTRHSVDALHLLAEFHRFGCRFCSLDIGGLGREVQARMFMETAATVFSGDWKHRRAIGLRGSRLDAR